MPPRSAKASGENPACAPELLGKGRYAIYQAPNGDGIISYRPDDIESDAHQVVPAKIWALILGAIRGEVKQMSALEIVKIMMAAR
jgi:hypothetical protein